MATMVIATINGIEIPVEVSDEELKKATGATGASEEALSDARQSGYREGIEEGVKNLMRWIIDEMADYLDDDSVIVHDSYDYMTFAEELTTESDEEIFAKMVADGTLKNSITEYIKSHTKKYKYFRYNVQASRLMPQDVAFSVTIKAESREESDEKMSNLDFDDVEDYIDPRDWENDSYNLAEECNIEDWDLDEELDEDEYGDCINEEE